MSKLTKIEKKVLCIVLSTGYGSAKKIDNPCYNIFTDRVDWSRLDTVYTKVLDKLGLQDFWDDNQKYINKSKNDV